MDTQCKKDICSFQWKGTEKQDVVEGKDNIK